MVSPVSILVQDMRAPVSVLVERLVQSPMRKLQPSVIQIQTSDSTKRAAMDLKEENLPDEQAKSLVERLGEHYEEQ